MTEAVYFANMGRVRIKTGMTTGGTPVPIYAIVGVLKKIEIKVNWEFAPLRGMNSILRQGVVKYNQEIEVNINWGLFDIDPEKDIFAKALAPGTAAADIAAALTLGVPDTNRVFLFDVDAYVTDEATADVGNAQYAAYTATGCYMETVPIVTAAENEWITRDLTCKGRNLLTDYLTVKPDEASWKAPVYGGAPGVTN